MVVYPNSQTFTLVGVFTVYVNFSYEMSHMCTHHALIINVNIHHSLRLKRFTKLTAQNSHHRRVLFVYDSSKSRELSFKSDRKILLLAGVLHSAKKPFYFVFCDNIPHGETRNAYNTNNMAHPSNCIHIRKIYFKKSFSISKIRLKKTHLNISGSVEECVSVCGGFDHKRIAYNKEYYYVERER